jgi:anti-sigma-K factor RskA
MTLGEHIPLEDLALYAMHDGTAEEQAAVRLHLEECVECRDELAAVSRDLALVAQSVEQHPLPEGARQRFIARISITEPQGPAARVIPIAKEPKIGRALVWAPWLLAAALAIVAILLGMRTRSLDEQLRGETRLAAELTARAAYAQEVLDVLSAPSAQRVLIKAAKTAPTPTGRAIYLPSRGGLIFEANNLASLPVDKTYELWVIPASGNAPIPAGLFRPDASGSASVVLPPLPAGAPAKAFGVTIEKAGGSLTPTAPILLSGAA